MIWSIVASPPPRFQLETVPLVWSRLLPSSKDGLTQKLPASRLGTAERATDKSSTTMTPVTDGEPPETKEQRIFTAPGGTARDPLRLVNAESSMVLTQPGLVVPVVTKWVGPPTVASEPSKNRTVKRISVESRLYISYHWISNVSPGLACPLRATSEYHSP